MFMPVTNWFPELSHSGTMKGRNERDVVYMYVYMYMNNHVHSAPQLERKKEKNREERKKNHTL